MPNIDRFPIYLQFGLVKAVIGSESHYSSTPEGDLDVDRLIRSLPAFQSYDDSRRYKKKRLVINRLDPKLYIDRTYYVDFQLSKLMTLRQLLVDGFEIYQYQTGKCVKLTPLALSELFLKSPSQTPDDTVHQAAIEQFGISFDDVAVLSQDNIEKITLPLSKLPQTLWLSDIYSLGKEEWHTSALENLRKTWEPRTSNFVVNYASSWIIYDLRDRFKDKIQDYIFHIYKIQGSLVEQSIDSQNIDWSHLEKIIWQGTYYCDEKYVAEQFASLSSLMSSSSFLREVEIINIQEYPLSTTAVNLEQLESIRLKNVGIAQPRLISLLQNAPQLKHLTLFNVACPMDTSSEYPVLDNLQSLEIVTRLEIHDSLFSNPSTISDFIKKIGPHLKKLRLKIQSSFDVCGWTNELSELEELDLSGSKVSGSGLGVLLKTMPHLKKLNLMRCEDLTIQDLDSTVELKELEELNLRDSNVDGKLLADLLKQSTCLKSLNLQNCRQLHKRACKFNVTLSLLEEIELGSSTIQNKQLASILKDAVRLKILDLHYRNNKIDQTILLADDTPFKTMNLISLATFNPGVLLNKDQFISVLNAAPKLLNLGLMDDFLLGYLMSEQECDAILEGRLLHLEKLEAVLRENNQLHALIKHMPRLKVLDLISRSETGLSLDAPVKRVEKLVLSSLNTIKACQLVQFLQAASHLKTLYIPYCRNLIDDVGDFKAHLTNLSSIVLSGSYVTDRFLLSLLSNAPNIRDIDLRNCKIVTTSCALTEQLKDSIAQFKMKNPECFPVLDSSPTYCLLSELPDKDRYKTKTIYDPGKGYEGNFSGQNQAYMKSQQTMTFNQTKTLDSDTTNKHTTFYLKKIFQSLTLGADLPGVHQYRLSCFNHYQENNNECSPHNAFSLDNEGDLQLTDISFEDLQSFDGGIKRLGKKCYYAKTKLQLNQDWQALPSVSSTEILTHLHVSIENVNIEVKYAKRDNLYYIRKKTGFSSFVDLDFLLEEPGNLSDEKIPDVLQPLLDYCLNFKSLPLAISVDNPKGSNYLEALVSQATGSCRHRSLVLKALMDNPLLRQKLPLPLRNELMSLPYYPVRIINNDCHSFVEIKINSQWIRVDLGGYAAQLDVDETPFKAFTSKSDVCEVTEESLELSEQKVQFELTQESCLKPSGQTAQPVEKNYFPDMVLSEDIPSLDAYLQKSCQPTEDKLLILADSNQAAALNYHIQSYCQRSGRSVYYVHEPDDLMCQLPYADIKDLPDGRLQGELKQGPGGSMFRFLTQASFQDQRIIVVNFNHFPANKLASFNSLLDYPPNIDGVPLPLGTKVIGFLDRNHPQDASFYSRFAGNFSPCPFSSDELKVSNIIQDVESEPADKPEDILHIDLHGSLIWKSELLGYWTLEGQALTYNNGALIQALSKKPVPKKIMLINAPLLDERFQQFWHQAQLKGYIEYENRRIDFPKDIILCHQSGYQLENDVITGVSYQPCSKPLQVINNHLLSGFLKKYEYHDTERSIYQIDGLLKQHQERTSKPFEVYLSESMSLSNWSILRDACTKSSVKLSITVAPGAMLPTTYPAPPARVVEFLASTDATQAILSSDRDVSVKQFQQTYTDAICIDVTELEASDLLTKLDGEFDNINLKFTFKQYQGALLMALDAGKTVILHGKLSDEIRDRLASLLMTRRYVTPESIAGRLILVSEDETINQLTGLVPVMKHDVSVEEKQTQLLCYAESLIDDKTDNTLARLNLDTINHKKTLTEQQAIVRNRLIHLSDATINDNAPWLSMEKIQTKPAQVEPFVIQNALSQANAIDELRLQQVQQTLQYSPFVFLAGISGIGKTTFVENVWQNPTLGRQLYIAEPQNKRSFLKILEAWACDDSPGKKALFIDEANITQNQWSLCEGLFNSPPGIMIGHRYFPLSNAHKIIFAGNPTAYSDDRQLPMLFKRHGNSVLFEPLTSTYIWQRMLRCVFESQNQLDKAEEICQPILTMNQYLNALSTTETLLSPRELVMISQLSLLYCKTHAEVNPSQIAAYYAYSLARPFVPKEKLGGFDAQFKVPRPQVSSNLLLKDAELLITESNREAAEMLNDFLMLRAQQIEMACAHQPILSSGLGGITFESAPGLGKSVLVLGILRARGFTRKIYQEHSSIAAVDKQYYMLPVSFSPREKEKVLLRAFEEGAVVVCDEINSSASMEQLLNRLLMGKNMAGKPAQYRGFMLVGTQNPMTMAGRIKPSAAMMHRTHYRVIPHYSEAEMHEIVMGLGLPLSRATILIKQYMAKSATNKHLCFRDVINRAKEGVQALRNIGPLKQSRDESISSGSELITLIQSMSQKDRLITLYECREKLATFFPSEENGNRAIQSLLENFEGPNHHKAQLVLMYVQETQSRSQVQDFGFFVKKIGESSRIQQLAEAQALMQDIENEIEEQSKCRKSF